MANLVVASASRHSLAFVPETTHGVTPETPDMTYLRHTSCSLGVTRDSFQSEEKRHDRQIADVRTGTHKVGGSIGFEISWGEFDAFFAAGLAGAWAGDVLKAGTVAQSFTLERGHPDIGEYTSYKGCFINKLSFSVKPNAMITGSFDVLGLAGATSATPLSVSPKASQTGRVFDSYTGSLTEGGLPIGVVTALDIALDNGIQPQFVIFEKAAPFVSWGKSSLTGTLSVFFTDNTLAQKFLDGSTTSLEFTLGDGTNKSYIFTIPCALYTGADCPMQADGPLIINMPFMAMLDPVLGTNLQIKRATA